MTSQTFQERAREELLELEFFDIHSEIEAAYLEQTVERLNQAHIEAVEQLIGEDETSGKHFLNREDWIAGAAERNQLRAALRAKLRGQLTNHENK